MVLARRSSRRLASLGVDGTPTRVIAGAVRRLLLQGREERLRDGVVEGRAALGHREVDAGLAAALTEGQRDVLRAAIGRWTRPAAGRRHLAGSRPRLITSAAPRRFLVHSSGSGVAGRRAARETAPRHGRRSGPRRISARAPPCAVACGSTAPSSTSPSAGAQKTRCANTRPSGRASRKCAPRARIVEAADAAPCEQRQRDPGPAVHLDDRPEPGLKGSLRTSARSPPPVVDLNLVGETDEGALGGEGRRLVAPPERATRGRAVPRRGA